MESPISRIEYLASMYVTCRQCMLKQYNLTAGVFDKLTPILHAWGEFARKKRRRRREQSNFIEKISSDISLKKLCVRNSQQKVVFIITKNLFSILDPG